MKSINALILLLTGFVCYGQQKAYYRMPAINNNLMVYSYPVVRTLMLER